MSAFRLGRYLCATYFRHVYIIAAHSPLSHEIDGEIRRHPHVMKYAEMAGYFAGH